MDKTFFNFKLDLEPNVIDMIYDILRMSTIQIVTQTMFYMNNSSLSLFSETFVKTFIFINMSILFYYLVVRKVFSFVSHDYLNIKGKTYTQTPPMKSSDNSTDKTSTPSLPTKPLPSIPSPESSPESPPSSPNTPDPNNNTKI